MPVEKPNSIDVRVQGTNNLDTPTIPERTFFATGPQFQEPEVPSLADDALKVARESIDIHNLPIHWESLAELGRAIRGLTGTLTDLTALKPPPDVQEFLPMLASVIAHKNNPEIPVEFPTQEQIKAAKPWMESIQRFLSRFSERAARGLGNYAEREGERVIQNLGGKITAFADFVGTIENPQAELLREVALIYKHLQEDNGVPIERRVEQFMRDVQRAKSHPESYDDRSYFLNSHNFPILLKGFSKLNVSLASLDAHQAGIAGAEFMKGIETFLRQKGVQGIGLAPRPQEFDFFDPSTWERGLAEWFATEKLEQVKEELPSILSSAYEALPTSGKEFKEKIYTIAENIYVLHKNGYSATDIVQGMFPGMGQIRTETNAKSAPEEILTGEMGAGSFLGLIAGGVAVFYFGASIIYIPVAAVAGMALGAVTGAVGLFNFFKKQAEK
ncbi:MAG: hypothetical protein WC880_03420 [Candidatus Paceibacterota bacterium]